mmetsp:Transcript_51996/g.135762  ORF Transcript_51996/g.135762 Transcript_51996/m.135762 type:complete len:372 (+) Transcript_51996:370-1485(+)
MNILPPCTSSTTPPSHGPSSPRRLARRPTAIPSAARAEAWQPWATGECSSSAASSPRTKRETPSASGICLSCTWTSPLPRRPPSPPAGSSSTTAPRRRPRGPSALGLASWPWAGSCTSSAGDGQRSESSWARCISTIPRVEAGLHSMSQAAARLCSHQRLVMTLPWLPRAAESMFLEVVLVIISKTLSLTTCTSSTQRKNSGGSGRQLQQQEGELSLPVPREMEESSFTADFANSTALCRTQRNCTRLILLHQHQTCGLYTTGSCMALLLQRARFMAWPKRMGNSSYLPEAILRGFSMAGSMTFMRLTTAPSIGEICPTPPLHWRGGALGCLHLEEASLYSEVMEATLLVYSTICMSTGWTKTPGSRGQPC